MVSAGAISKEFGIPRATLYRLVQTKKIPVVDVTRPWHERKRYAFRRSDVQQAIDKMSRRADA